MTLRLKLTFSFLFVSLITALTVGLIAWWMVMQDFRQSVEDQAFANFQQDIVAYIKQYGSWEAANRAQEFTQFVMRRHSHPDIPPSNFLGKPQQNARSHQPPFRFLLLSESGEVVRDIDDYHRGDQVPISVKDKAQPITIDGKIVLYAVQLGDPVLSIEDEVYLSYIQHSLLLGIGFATVLAIVLGLLFGQRLVSNLEILIKALKAMHPDGEIPNPLPVKSKDEIGQLAATFNQMSKSLAQCHQELRELSIRDPLTSLYNRRYFDEQAGNMLKHAKRYQESLCVMITDIDHFKHVNDTFSHSVGDLVIQRTAKLLSQHIRKSDLLARYGGEEFIVVFANTTLNNAREHCEQLRKRIEAEPWYMIEPELKVTISLGLCDDTQMSSIESMIRQADKRLYEAKRNGRNRVEPAAAVA